MKSKLLFALLFISQIVGAANGTIKGLLQDSATKEPLAFASVSIKGTTQGVNTDLDGFFTIEVPEGTQTLTFNYVGYTSADQTIVVKPNETVEVTIDLISESVQLEGVVVQATRSKSREATLLIEQQRSVEMKQHIGSQELSRKGVSDVASAVAKTTGVAKQEGSGTIFVRGLGDRYNSTLLNGLPLASNDPEKKNIDLNIFSTDIVEYIAIDKTYFARNYGDFAGGNIDIRSKNHTGAGYVEVGLSSNVNTNALKQDNFKTLSDRSFFGFSDKKIPGNALNGYNFKNSTQTDTRSPWGAGLNINTGKSFFFGSESALHLFATASFGNNFKHKEGITRTAQAQNSFTKDLNLEAFEYSTNTTGMVNAHFDINASNAIKYNFLFVNDSKEKNEDYTGYMRDITLDNSDYTYVNRQTYRQDRLMVNQLLGNHKMTDQIDLNWGAAFNNISAQTPDRQQYTLNKLKNSDSYAFSINSRSDNNRYFEDLKENEFAANIAADYKFAQNEENLYDGKLTVGYNFRKKERNFKATQFVFQINSDYNNDINPNALDSFFNQSNFAQGYFDIYTFRGGSGTPNAMLPQTYDGDLLIHAGFVNVEYRLTPKLSGSIGARFETISQDVSWQTQLDSDKTSNKFTKNAFLPSLSLKYEVNDNNNLRFALSKTYTLPQFKERARFIYEDVTEIKVGNPDLYASDDYNVDLKWEYFPQTDEVISATVFGKYIKNPINEIVSASSSNDITYANTGDYGYATGLEIEVRKNLFSFDDALTNKITGGINASIMKTYQKLDNEKVNSENKYLSTSFTHDNASFTGASDLLLNADISYIKEWANDQKLMATLSYAHFSDKLYSLGTEQSGNLVDKAFGFLDFAFKYDFSKRFGMSFNAKNLLDPAIERKQENLTQDVLVQSYKLGQNFSLGFKYTF
ncbi:TonB-dependent receptor [Myroides sp. DF42-4-2]|uniref:TonB-dependent receptor n=1 Tax=unclassified Myroides TaxID=2642485 RepID=UPI002578F656|nr:TonB-dependent receptor [Myroides sp. DF42-4-2]MDM1408779.1 TonB-dependent receptor [Myroides sp. DF42-4-2]